MQLYNYPDIPEHIVLNAKGRRRVLRAARTLSEIVLWAEGIYGRPRVFSATTESPLLEETPLRDWFVVTGISKSGLQVWDVFLFCFCRSGRPDRNRASSWNAVLCAASCFETRALNDVACVYVDAASGELRFCRRNGRALASVKVPPPPRAAPPDAAAGRGKRGKPAPE